jgi:hypothetical protein
MFRAFSRPSSGTQWLQWQPLLLPSYRGDSHAVFAGRPARPRTQHDCHNDMKVKAEAATAVIELLMMGGKTPETCWAVNKRQDNNTGKLLVIYLNCTMMHGLTNLKNIFGLSAASGGWIASKPTLRGQFLSTSPGNWNNIKEYQTWHS